MLRSKVKITGTKTRYALPSAPAATEWKRSLQITSFRSRLNHSVAVGGDFGGLCAVYVW